ncbi:hypothetical protein BCV69DRAFT_310909 [Microstroma glucosiphilum]|uniref:Uncharacterized protein n=1 Tax=Pseudomicrostroma glucosiphilum TaxID=1684307 RepID=A0A316UEW8_9BASI|nr:hypothetical protein BCV69DRAFT_310909 [Pseudomicrostroma glucosiphilum]PWN23454.1 hypothetical protein BCV69DRAFT_310909 [Pseudomicrostroma glucosiphilum]
MAPVASSPPLPTNASGRTHGRSSPNPSGSSHAHLVTLPIHNPTLAPPLQTVSSSRLALYGLPGVTTSTQSLNANASVPAVSPGPATTSLEPLAPHLASAEAHLGRMTLTAPDNMMRRRAQEKEKERRARKIVKKQERAREAMVALSGSASHGHRPLPILTVPASAPGRAPRSRPVTPQDHGSSSSGGEARRARNGRSPNRSTRERATSAPRAPEAISQDVAAQVQTSAPSARQSRTRAHDRDQPRTTHSRSSTGVLAIATGESLEASSSGGAALALDPPSRPASASSAPRAVENTNVNVPRMNPSGGRQRSVTPSIRSNPAAPPPIEAEPAPPPFPEGSTRPPSPPRAPPTEAGEFWTSDDERTWADYRRRVPDSPPPAFLSEASESDSEEQAEQAISSASAPAHSPADGDHSDDSSEGSVDVTLRSPMSEDRRAWEDDVQRGLSFEQRVQRLEARRRRADNLAGTAIEIHEGDRRVSGDAGSPLLVQSQPEPSLATPVEAAASVRAEVSILQTPGATSSLPSAVALAPSPTPSAAIPATQLPSPSANMRPTDPSALVMPPQVGLSQNRALAQLSLPRPAGEHSKQPKKRPSAARPGPGREPSTSSLAPTAVRPRPTSDSYSRFRDDASAAADRRRLAWGFAPGRQMEIVTAPARRSEADLPALDPHIPTAAIGSNVPSTMPGAFLDADDHGTADDSDPSSSSEAEWAAETAAFEALRRAAETTAAVQDSEEDSDGSGEEYAHHPALLRSPMTRLEDALPKAPPPLALGRTRGGGVAYDASDSDDSLGEDDESESEDSGSEDDGLVRVVNPRWALPSQEPAQADRALYTSASAADRAAPEHHVDRVKGEQDATAVRSPTSRAQKAAQKQRRGPRKAAAAASRASSSAPDLVLPAQSSLADAAGPAELGSAYRRGGEDDSAPVRTVSRPSLDSAHTFVDRRPSTTSLKTTSGSSIWHGRLPGAPIPPSRQAETTDRLKDLFGVPLSPSSPTLPDRAYLDTVKQTELPPRLLPSQSSSADRHATPSNSVAQTDEQQLRRDTLLDIARLQGVAPQGSSLAALERLLANSLRSEPVDASNAVPIPGARLSRQGAITSSRRSSRPPPPVPPRTNVPLITAASIARSGSFINPRSSFAPLPRQTRLPTITDATRHFPRTTGDGGSAAGDEEIDAQAGSERRPPALPPRIPVAGGRVSAMLERFEGPQRTGAAAQSSPGPHREVAMDGVEAPSGSSARTSTRPFSPPLIDLSIPDSGPPSTPQRRRPPPPPPTLAEAAGSASHQSSPAPPLPPRIAETLVSNPEAPALPRSTSYPHLFHTDSPQDRARRSALDALIRNEVAEERPVTAPTTPGASGSSRLAQRPPPSLPGDSPSRPLHSGERRPLPVTPGPPGSAVVQVLPVSSTRRDSDTPSSAQPPASAAVGPSVAPANGVTSETGQRYITDLDIVASRLEADPSSSHFDDIALLQDFLGPALPSSLSPAELSSIPLGIVEVEKRRVTKEGKTKTKLACLGVRVDRCGICLGQFKEGQGAYVLGGCLHVFHGRAEAEGGPASVGLPSPDCAREWFRRSRVCPMCRVPALEEDRARV